MWQSFQKEEIFSANSLSSFAVKMGKRRFSFTADPLAFPSRKPLSAINTNIQANNKVLRPKKLEQLLCDDEGKDEHQELKLRAPSGPPVQRILNEELGRNVQPMQPLMSMDKELCPAVAESEEQGEAGEEVERESQGDNRAAVVAIEKPSSNLLQKFKRSNVVDMKITAQSQINGQIVKQETYYDTWYVIRPKVYPSETRQQRHLLELPLVKLANASTHMKLPTESWSSKVTLYKVAPNVLQRHTLTIFTGDLKVHRIPERERHKYQPSCVIFRRELPQQERSKCHVPYDRAIIFKHKQFTVNFDGKLVNLMGCPESICSVQDVHRLLDILESITLSHSMIEIVTPK